MLSRIKILLNINGLEIDNIGKRLRKNLGIYCREKQKIEINLMENSKLMDAISDRFERCLANIHNRGKYSQVESFSKLFGRIVRSENDEIAFLNTGDEYRLLIGIEKIYLDMMNKRNSSIVIIELEEFYNFLNKELL